MPAYVWKLDIVKRFVERWRLPSKRYRLLASLRYLGYFYDLAHVSHPLHLLRRQRGLVDHYR